MTIIPSTDSSLVKYQVADTKDLILRAKRLCHDVYVEFGFIEKPYDDNIIPYQYDRNAIYIVALSNEGDVVGTLRLATGGQFEIFEMWEAKLFPSCVSLIKNVRKENSVEIGALAVRKDYGAGKVSFGLYSAAYFYCLQNEVDYAIISMDVYAFLSLEKQGWYVIKIGAPMHYFGSLTVPGIIPIKEQPTLFSSKQNESRSYRIAN